MRASIGAAIVAMIRELREFNTPFGTRVLLY